MLKLDVMIFCRSGICYSRFICIFRPSISSLSETANFTSYTKDSFGEEDQRRLAKVFRELDAKHCNVMLSNSDTDFIRGLYKGYDAKVVYAKRAINSKGTKRGPIKELVVRNYQ